MGLAGLRAVNDISPDALLMPAPTFTIPPPQKVRKK